MNDKNILSKLAIITPSKVFSSERFKFTYDSITSLHKHLRGSQITHLVVHDTPKQLKYVPTKILTIFNPYKWSKKTEDLYRSLGISLIKGSNEGSAKALLLSVEHALLLNKIYGFIHLDDHVYCDPFLDLLRNGLDAMEQNNNLIWTRYSGYPILYNEKKTLTIGANDKIIFDNVELSPIRMKNYTLWSSLIKSEVNQGNYWPVAMWFSIFRLKELKNILELALHNKKKHLADVEVFYKEEHGFKNLIDASNEKSFGYINMQFGGFEMHRNINWSNLIAIENNAIR